MRNERIDFYQPNYCTSRRFTIMYQNTNPVCIFGAETIVNIVKFNRMAKQNTKDSAVKAYQLINMSIVLYDVR